MSKTLLVEIRNIAIGVIILGAVQVLVTLPTKFFGLSAIFGTLLGCAVAILNFALMGIILERCVSKQKGASGLMGVGYIPADFYIHTKSYEKKGKGSVRR